MRFLQVFCFSVGGFGKVFMQVWGVQLCFCFVGCEDCDFYAVQNRNVSGEFSFEVLVSIGSL